MSMIKSRPYSLCVDTQAPNSLSLHKFAHNYFTPAFSMAVKNFMTYLGDSAKSTNTSLKKLLQKNSEKNWIGVDVSIMIIRAIKVSPNLIGLLFSEPPRPINGLSEKIISDLNFFMQNGFTIVCVFDGSAHKLKGDETYLSCYGRNRDKVREMQELY